MYRGKREDTQEWVEGIYFEKYGESYIINIDQSFVTTFYTQPSVFDFNVRAYKTIPETVGACVNWRDMHQRLIFEGDIIIAIPATGKDCKYCINVKFQIRFLGLVLLDLFLLL